MRMAQMRALTPEDLESQQEEDRYKVMLSRSDSENIASNYFRPKRASQILSTDPMKSLSECPALLLPSSPSPRTVQACCLLGGGGGVGLGSDSLGQKPLSLSHEEPQFPQLLNEGGGAVHLPLRIR